MRTKVCLAATSILFAFATAGSAATFSGIDFADNAFADRVITFTVGDGVSNQYANPENVLGTPDASGVQGQFALGLPGQPSNDPQANLIGSVTIQFVDNALTTSGDDSDDLFIFEFGPAVELFSVEISKDLLTWIDLGIVSGQPTSIDIDSFSEVSDGDLFSYVRVTDAPNGPRSTGSLFSGPDIDAIGAITSAPAVPTVPLPAGLPLILVGLGAFAMVKRRQSKATDV